MQPQSIPNGPEEWRPVSGYEGLYEVSSTGRVRGLDRPILRKDGRRSHQAGRVLKVVLAGHGYESLRLCRDGVLRHRYVHELVAEAFLHERPTPAHQVNHRDGHKRHNTAANLEWMTNAENNAHALAKGLRVGAGRKLTEDDVRVIRASAERQKALAKRYGVSRSLISHVRRGKAWKRLNG